MTRTAVRAHGAVPPPCPVLRDAGQAGEGSSLTWYRLGPTWPAGHHPPFSLQVSAMDEPRAVPASPEVDVRRCANLMTKKPSKPGFLRHADQTPDSVT